MLLELPAPGTTMANGSAGEFPPPKRKGTSVTPSSFRYV